LYSQGKPLFAGFEGLLRLLALGDIVRHAAYKRDGDAFCAQGVVILPDAPITAFGLDEHQAASAAFGLDLSQVTLELPANFGGQDIPQVHLGQFIFGVTAEPAGG